MKSDGNLIPQKREIETKYVFSNDASLFLDALRLSCSIVVLIVHAYSIWFPVQFKNSPYADNIAHGAVIVFFVLSGYVIAFSTSKSNRGKLQYAQARLSRLYSVLIPSLFVTAICEFILHKVDPFLFSQYFRGASLFRYLISGLFCNEIWFFSAAPPINGVLWSLSYEFWYYVIFGFWAYRNNSIMSYLGILVVCLIAGPKILLMMPLWLAGCAAYRVNRFLGTGWILVGCFFAAAVLMILLLPSLPFPLGKYPFYFAGRFLTDWVTGLVVAMVFWFIPSGKDVPAGSIKSNDTFRKLADLTFPIYVLHFPLLVLFRASIDFKINSVSQMILAILTVLIFSSIMGIFVEQKRPFWTNLFKQLFNYFKAGYLKFKADQV